MATEVELSDCLIAKSKVFAMRPLEEKLAMSWSNVLASIMNDPRTPSSVRLLGQTQ